MPIKYLHRPISSLLVIALSVWLSACAEPSNDQLAQSALKKFYQQSAKSDPWSLASIEFKNQQAMVKYAALGAQSQHLVGLNTLALHTLMAQRCPSLEQRQQGQFLQIEVSIELTSARGQALGSYPCDR